MICKQVLVACTQVHNSLSMYMSFFHAVYTGELVAQHDVRRRDNGLQKRLKGISCSCIYSSLYAQQYNRLNRNVLSKRLIFQFVLQDEVLRMAVQRFKGKNWKKIGKKMGLGLRVVSLEVGTMDLTS